MNSNGSRSFSYLLSTVLFFTQLLHCNFLVDFITHVQSQTLIPVVTEVRAKNQIDSLTDQELVDSLALKCRISCRLSEARIDSALSSLSDKYKIRLFPADSLSARRISANLHDVSLSVLMQKIANSQFSSWRKTGLGYELFQTQEQIDFCARLIKKSKQNESHYRGKQMDELLSQINKELSKPGDSRSPLADVLANVDSGVMQSCLNSAMDEIAVASASDERHLFSHFHSLGPASSLSGSQQSGVSRIVMADAFPGYNDQSNVGLVGAYGNIFFAVVDPTGKNLQIDQNHSFGHVAIPSLYNNRTGYDPDISKLIHDKKHVDLTSMPAQLRKRLIKIDRISDKDRLSDWLNRTTEQIGVDYISDCFLYSGALYNQPYLSAGSTYTVEQVLEEIANASFHSIKFVNGLLALKSLTPGLDFRLEPPLEVSKSIDRLTPVGSVPNRDDLIIAGKCTVEQLNLIQRNHKVMSNPYSIYLWQATNIYPFLHFYYCLSQDQKDKAWSEAGLKTTELRSVQLQAQLTHN